MPAKKRQTKKKTSLDKLENFSSGKIEDEDIKRTKELEEVKF